MYLNNYADAIDYLKKIIGLPLVYGIKSPDMDLYDFGFGTQVWKGAWRNDLPTYSIHSVCEFDIIWNNDPTAIEEYDANTPCDIFHSKIESIIGQKVKKIVLSKENDLLLKFETCKIVFYTFNDEEESWRFFACDKEQPHLVMSSTGQDFVY